MLLNSHRHLMWRLAPFRGQLASPQERQHIYDKIFNLQKSTDRLMLTVRDTPPRRRASELTPAATDLLAEIDRARHKRPGSRSKWKSMHLKLKTFRTPPCATRVFGRMGCPPRGNPSTNRTHPMDSRSVAIFHFSDYRIAEQLPGRDNRQNPQPEMR
jgi:hypothetical protein